MGWTLSRYFFLRYATIATWFFLGVFALIFLVDFTEFSRRVSGIPGVTIGAVLTVSALRVPMIMQQTVPFVGLFAAMATLVTLNRKYELVVARAAGISAWQFLMPACVGALLFGVLTVTLLNPLAAYGFSRSEELEAEMRSGKSTVVSAFSSPWLRQRTSEGETIIGAQTILNQGLVLDQAVFISLDADGDIMARRDAKRAELKEGFWELTDVVISEGGIRLPPLASERVPTDLKPEYVQERLARPETIPLFQLPEKVEAARSLGLRADAFAMQFHSQTALPL